MLRPHATHFDALRAKLAPELEPAAMTIAEELISKGKAEGRVEGRMEGRLEGRQEGRTETLLDLLAAKFGPLSEAQIAIVRSADLEQLERFGQRILFADSIDAVLAD